MMSHQLVIARLGALTGAELLPGWVRLGSPTLRELGNRSPGKLAEETAIGELEDLLLVPGLLPCALLGVVEWAAAEYRELVIGEAVGRLHVALRRDPFLE